jgi:hypothetical protein
VDHFAGGRSQQRAFPFTLDAVQMFNVIDAVFIEARPVREAWALYFDSLDDNRQVSEDMKHQRFTELLAAMAKDIGLTGIGYSDLTRVYSPRYVMRALNIQTMQQVIQEADPPPYVRAGDREHDPSAGLAAVAPSACGA